MERSRTRDKKLSGESEYINKFMKIVLKGLANIKYIRNFIEFIWIVSEKK